MAQSVSNESLWGKLSEVDEKLVNLSTALKSSILQDNQAQIKPDFKELKDEIITEIKEQSERLGNHADKNFGTVNQNIDAMNKQIQQVGNILNRIRERQKSEPAESQKGKDTHFNFWLFKVRKTSLAITALSLLVLILTLFSMKQQNDYSLLINEYYRQGVAIKGIQELNIKKR